MMNFELVVPELCHQTDIHTDRQTYTLIVILRSPIGDRQVSRKIDN